MSSFDDTLIWAEREILALKTAWERGLGTLNFYRKSVDLAYVPGSPLVTVITATARAGEVSPFMAQLLFSSTEDFIATEVNTTTSMVQWKFYYNSLSSHNFTFTVIASSNFDLSVTQEGL